MANIALHSGKFVEVDNDDDVDYELATYDRLFGSHINAIPVQSAVQGPRLFYGARFENQALPLKDAEVPLVQNQDQDTGLSFDKLYGKYAGALESDDDYTVEKVDPDQMVLRNKAGSKVIKELYNNTPFNRKTSLNNISLVKAGDKVTKGQMLAKSNYTDDSGTLAMGKNALVGLVAYKGHSMDDAIVISQGFANKLTSEHSETHALDIDHNIKLNKNHFRSLFPENFNKDQLEKVDDDGVVKPGMILNEGDPIFLTTKPRTINSSSFTSGKLTKGLAQAREDASQKWHSPYPAEVIDVHKGRKGVKVLTKAYAPSKIGDKIVFRTGQKSIISEILPDEQMPKTERGETLEVLLNQLSLPSRTNVSLPYELALGKAAHKLGAPIVLPGFTKKGENWRDIVRAKLAEAGEDLKEKVYDPKEDRLLEDPITVGRGYIMKLHHTAASKVSARGQGSYDQFQQPTKGGGDSAQSKRLSGLETTVMLSSGAYNNIREASILRGQQNDDYWRQLKMGLNPRPPGVPFAWDKFNKMMAGAGINPKSEKGGVIRLTPMTDAVLNSYRPIELKNAELINMKDLSPVVGGLFDPALVSANAWGKITLPRPLPNPAYEKSIRTILGLKKAEFEEILRGNKTIKFKKPRNQG